MRAPVRLLPWALLPAFGVLGGCASSMNGVGGTERFACQAPVGAQCTSISGVYANARPLVLRQAQTPLPATAALASATSSAPPAPPLHPVPPAAMDVNAKAGATPSALRAAPRVVRMWIAPWEDADGDLHEASLVHVVIDTGRWLIERIRPPARARLDIARPPFNPSPATVPATDPKAQADQTTTEP